MKNNFYVVKMLVVQPFNQLMCEIGPFAPSYKEYPANETYNSYAIIWRLRHHDLNVSADLRQSLFTSQAGYFQADFACWKTNWGA